MSVTIKAGCGYWPTTRYPRGGEFRRAAEPIRLEEVRVLDTYRNGAPREFYGRSGKETICVSAECCEVTL